MKRSNLKRKPVVYADLEIRKAFKLSKAALKKSTGRMKSRKAYVNGQLCDSQWEAEKYIELLWREKAGEIKDLDHHLVITYKVYNDRGDFKQYQINIDFQYFDKNLNRPVRCDRKSSQKLVKKVQPDWLIRWDLLKLAEPDYQYELEYMR